MSLWQILKRSFKTWLVGLIVLLPTMFLVWLGTVVPAFGMAMLFGILAAFVGCLLNALDTELD